MRGSSTCRHRGAVAIATAAGSFEAGAVVNCAGLQADRVARLAGVDAGVQIVPFRGEYFRISSRGQSLVRHPIYPVPNPAFPFLGVHLTPRLDGRIEAGPNAVLAWHREGYRSGSFSARDAAELLGYPGFWRFAARHWRLGLAEMGRSWSRERFVTALQRLVPAVRSEHLVAGGSGVRAQAVDRNGELVNDFLFVEGERSLHVLERSLAGCHGVLGDRPGDRGTAGRPRTVTAAVPPFFTPCSSRPEARRKQPEHPAEDHRDRTTWMNRVVEVQAGESRPAVELHDRDRIRADEGPVGHEAGGNGGEDVGTLLPGEDQHEECHRQPQHRFAASRANCRTRRR